MNVPRIGIVYFVSQQPTKSDIQLKIAVPIVNDNVDDHFGHCDHYTVFEIDENPSYPSNSGV